MRNLGGKIFRKKKLILLTFMTSSPSAPNALITNCHTAKIEKFKKKMHPTTLTGQEWQDSML